MENKGKTTPNQPPIPRPVGFLYLYFPFVSSWLQVNYAKQTQFPKPQNPHNPFYPKDLRQYSPSPQSKKQTQTNPISPLTHAIRYSTSDIHHPALSPVEQSLFIVYAFSSPLVWLSAQSAPSCPQAALMPRPIRKRIVVSIPDSSRISAKRSIFSVLLPVNSHPR